MFEGYAGRHVVITGGTGALGWATVKLLLEADATCHVPVRGPEPPGGLENAGHPQLRLTPNVDLADEAAVEAFYQPLDDLWASIHIAGGFAMGPIARQSLTDFRRMMDVNATTCFLCCREATKKLRATGRGGRIVNVTSKPALVPTGGMLAYAASKAAVASITQCLAEELAADRIWVNAVVPSIMDTPANRQAMPRADHNRWPKLDEVAATIAFLASPANQATRGALVAVYGQA